MVEPSGEAPNTLSANCHSRSNTPMPELDTGGFTVACSTCPGGTGGGVPVVDSDSEIQSVTARVNYRFGK